MVKTKQLSYVGHNQIALNYAQSAEDTVTYFNSITSLNHVHTRKQNSCWYLSGRLGLTTPAGKYKFQGKTNLGYLKMETVAKTASP